MADLENVWQYWSESFEQWYEMPREYSLLHDKVVAQNMTHFEYDLAYAHGTKFYHYVVDLVAMTQKNCNTGKVRRIRRLVPQTPY